MEPHSGQGEVHDWEPAQLLGHVFEAVHSTGALLVHGCHILKALLCESFSLLLVGCLACPCSVVLAYLQSSFSSVCIPPKSPCKKLLLDFLQESSELRLMLC